jgi:response regulator of citrate/malate metabolism
MIRVLVVDDDYHVAHAHALTVDRVEGFVVVGEAHTGEEAQRLVAEARPDLLLLDMYLPDFSGLDLVRRLAAAGDSVPDFLLVTAARDIDSVRTAMQLGAFYYLVKPFSVVALREQLEAYRSWVERLLRTPASGRHIDQDLVDSLYSLRGTSPRRATATRALQPTMARVLEIVTGAPGPISAAEVAEILGASRPTAQRYLANLVNKQLLDLTLTYGSTGRPEHRYLPRRR